jgi:hypothetical protein
VPAGSRASLTRSTSRYRLAVPFTHLHHPSP